MLLWIGATSVFASEDYLDHSVPKHIEMKPFTGERYQAEVPDTLLLAEAFWLMEGYFVRTLGMHRVYNSAFMHMLRDEDNAKYRLAIKNTLEFDPQILKRYVNFMNNPDEKTAVEQFGSGDKYFGICTVLSTLPELPMFGHGQVEGYSEKYGMEFRRAKWDESPDEGLVRGHEWRIFPILHHRYLFADVEQFLLYDFYSPNGGVDEEVFAYSNRFNEERGLVVYHNKFADTRGWIKTSAAYTDKASGKALRKNIAEGLGLPRVGHVIFKDYVTQLEYIRSCKEIWDKGMYIELGAYQCHAFMDWRFVGDSEWGTICDQLNGGGVQSMQDEWRKLFSVVEEVKSEEKILVKKVRGKKKEVAAKPVKVRSKKEELAIAKTKAPTTSSSKKEKCTVKKALPKAKKAVIVKPKKKAATKAKPVVTSSRKGKKLAVKKVVTVKSEPKKKVFNKAKLVVISSATIKKTAKKSAMPKKVVVGKFVTKKSK